MTPDPTIMKAVEKLDYRVTVGDVATQAGIEINQAQQGLLNLASEAGGHLQVAESGDIAYLFPENFRTILRNKYWRIKFQEWWQKVWNVLFYLIRISFGIILILSIIIMAVTIAVIVISASSSRDDDDGGGGMNFGGGGGGFYFIPRIWFGPDIFWWFTPGYDSYYERKYKAEKRGEKPKMSFLEAIFSFLFGDGDPNWNLEERQWQSIGTVIRNNSGAVAGEQIAPYMYELDPKSDRYEYEEYMLPVLARFNGYPEVSEQGDIIYYFPELQVSAVEQQKKAVPAYLREHPWRFTEATGGQTMLAAGLGGLNFVLALVLYSLLQGGETGFVGFVGSIFWFLFAYAVAFLAVPLVRYFWIQWKNKRIEERVNQRQEFAMTLNQADAELQRKLTFANQFAAHKALTEENLEYTTEKEMLDQNLERADKIDEEWRKRLEEGS